MDIDAGWMQGKCAVPCKVASEPNPIFNFTVTRVAIDSHKIAIFKINCRLRHPIMSTILSCRRRLHLFFLDSKPLGLQDSPASNTNGEYRRNDRMEDRGELDGTHIMMVSHHCPSSHVFFLFTPSYTNPLSPPTYHPHTHTTSVTLKKHTRLIALTLFHKPSSPPHSPPPPPTPPDGTHTA